MDQRIVSEKAVNIHFHIGDISCTLISALPFQHFNTAGRKYFEHLHHHFELHIIRQGECTFLCNEHPITVDNSKLLLLPLQIYHKEIRSTSDCERMSLSFDLKLFDGYSDKESRFYYDVFQKLRKPVLIDCTQNLKSQLEHISLLVAKENRTFLEQEKMRVAAHSVLIELLDAIADKSTIAGAAWQKQAFPLEYTIDNFFAHHYMDSSANKQLAALLHVSTRQLHRILMEHYGKNYREKLNETRVRVAAGFLMDSTMSISEISEKMGYSTSEHFATFIKNETGLTPIQIRKSGLPSAITKK